VQTSPLGLVARAATRSLTTAPFASHSEVKRALLAAAALALALPAPAAARGA